MGQVATPTPMARTTTATTTPTGEADARRTPTPTTSATATAPICPPRHPATRPRRSRGPNRYRVGDPSGTGTTRRLVVDGTTDPAVGRSRLPTPGSGDVSLRPAGRLGSAGSGAIRVGRRPRPRSR